MNNSDERDYTEEEYNRLTCPECDGQHEPGKPCKTVQAPVDGRLYDDWIKAMRDKTDYTPEEVEEGKAEELRQIGETTLPIGYGDSWDGSSTNQSNDFFVGQTGHVTILWHIINNPMEKYDPSKSYHMRAADGSALYVWCDLHFTYPDAYVSIAKTRNLFYTESYVHHL